MARSGTSIDEVIEAPGLTVGEVHERLLAAMSTDGDYQAVAVGSDRFQFARTFRPTWAIVTACITVWIALIGIVFLLVKTTETCLAVIEADHRGARLRLQGRISQPALGRLRAAMAGQVGPSPSGVVAQPPRLPGAPEASASPAGAIGAPVALTYSAAPSAQSAVPVAVPESSVPAAEPQIATLTPAVQADLQQAQDPRRTDGVDDHDCIQRTTDMHGVSETCGVVIPQPPADGARSSAPSVSTPPGQPPVVDTPGSAGALAAAGTPPQSPVVSQQQTWESPPGTGDDRSHTMTEPTARAVLDDGTEVHLGELTLIGRDPAATDAEQAHLVSIEDPTLSVSKTHLAIALESGTCSVTDRNSTNGVTIQHPSGLVSELTPCTPLSVSDGAVVGFGDRKLRIELGGSQ